MTERFQSKVTAFRSNVGYMLYLFLFKTSTFGIIGSVSAAFTFAYLDLLQGAVRIVFAVVFAFGYGAANGTVGSIVVVKHGYTLL